MANLRNYLELHDQLAEEALVGSCLIFPEKIELARSGVKPGDFNDPHLEDIFTALLDMAGQRVPVDIVTLSQQLTARGSLTQIGGLPRLMELANRSPAAEHIEQYTRIVKEFAVRRQTVRFLKSMAEQIGDLEQDPYGVISRFMLESSQLFDNAGHRVVWMKDLLYPVLERLIDRERADQEEKVSTGIPKLDLILGYLQPGETYVLGARPKMGKTTLALKMAQAAALSTSKAVVVISLEMKKEQMVKRMIASQSGVKLGLVQNSRFLGENHIQQLTHGTSQLHEITNLLIDDTAFLKPSDLMVKLRRVKSLYGLGLVVIDYLQLLEPEKNRNTRTTEVSDISRAVKYLAMELEVPVLCLSQLSRESERRVNHRPRPSDLRESGALEQDAAAVLFLHSDQYFDDQGEVRKNLPDPVATELIVALNRYGPGDCSIPMAFHRAMGRFEA